MTKWVFTHARGHEKIPITVYWETPFKLVAKHGAKIVGRLVWSYVDDVTGKRNASADWVTVIPEYRRMGIARTMLRVFFANKKLRRVEWLTAWTGSEIEQTGGYDLYLQLGFKEMCVCKDYYAKGIPTRMIAIKIGKGRSNKLDVHIK